jgi:hypothetical protein
MRWRVVTVCCIATAVLGDLGLALRNRPPASVASPAAQAPVAPIAQARPERRAEFPRGHDHAVPIAPPTRIPEPDPLAALSALAAQPPGPDRSATIAAMVHDVGRTDTAGALGLAQVLRSGTDDGALEHRLQLWTEQAPTDAIAWVKALPAGAQRDRLLARAAYVRVQSNSTEALELLQLMSADPANEHVTQSVLKLWQQRDPAGATAWLAQNTRSG